MGEQSEVDAKVIQLDTNRPPYAPCLSRVPMLKLLKLRFLLNSTLGGGILMQRNDVHPSFQLKRAPRIGARHDPYKSPATGMHL
jgi:hypothetical protein